MSEATSNAGGIEIGGESVDPGHPRLQSLVGDDKIRRQIVSALARATRRHTYASIDDLRREVTFRATLVETMSAFQTGADDADYFVPGSLHPRIGATRVVSGTWEDAQWLPADPNDPDSWTWDAPDDATAAEMFSSTALFPFRGECAGAFQLCTYVAAWAALGADVPEVPKSQIGDWTNNPARGLYQQPVDVGSDLVPGDYVYFKNKDDYSSRAPNGFWTGLNAMYMGDDALGAKRYSGMGAAWLDEPTLRSSLVNAYTHDCWPARVEHPLTEVRFTKQAVMQLPDATGSTPSEATSASGDTGAVATPTHDQLVAAGFRRHDDGTALYERTGASLDDVCASLGIDTADLRPIPSGPAYGSPKRASAGEAHVVLTPTEGELADAAVTAHVNLEPVSAGGSK